MCRIRCRQCGAAGGGKLVLFPTRPWSRQGQMQTNEFTQTMHMEQCGGTHKRLEWCGGTRLTTLPTCRRLNKRLPVEGLALLQGENSCLIQTCSPWEWVTTQPQPQRVWQSRLLHNQSSDFGCLETVVAFVYCLQRRVFSSVEYIFIDAVWHRALVAWVWLSLSRHFEGTLKTTMRTTHHNHI